MDGPARLAAMGRYELTSRIARVVILLAWVTLASCREDDQLVSGRPYVCDCHFPASEDELLLNVCEVTAGDAIATAHECAPSAGRGEPQYCDCLESSATFCDIGSCSERYQP
jgi:hypothetical protein